jgi:uncharacterized membrane protein
MANLESRPMGKTSWYPFRAAVVRGLGVLVPPLLTVVIFFWVINTTRQYFLEPVNAGVREALVWMLQSQVRDDLPDPDPVKRTTTVDGVVYYQLDDGKFVPQAVFDRVRRGVGNEPIPQTAKAVMERYVDSTYLRPYYAIPCFLALFTLLVYLLGKFMAAGIGGFFWAGVENTIHRLPLVRSVYSAVKQVSDFFLNERQIQFTRVVAVEFPRRGMWMLAFVTSEGLADVGAAANEAVIGIFIPSSPMPMTGYAMTVLRREVIDLSLTVDQAIQYLVSCGLVVPPQNLDRMRAAEPVPQLKS